MGLLPRDDEFDNAETTRSEEPVTPRFPHAVIRTTTRPTKAAVVILALAAAMQGVALGLRRGSVDHRSEVISVGTNLSSTAIKKTDGVLTLGAGKPTLLLAFDVDCTHSRRIAPEWSAWLAAAKLDDLAVLAVSRGPLSQAVSYATQAGWPVQIGSVDPIGSAWAGALTNRTPWVFAVDEEGLVVAEGHGTRIDEVARALLANRRDG